MRNPPPNKIHWTDEMDAFLTKNYPYMTNRQLAAALKLQLTSVRTRLYSLGYKRMELEYWTEAQVEFLRTYYCIIGDVELAEIFNRLWPKEKGWTKKHIEKKRRYLCLKRTKLQQKSIRKRNETNGRWSESHAKRWRGRAVSVGTVKIWNMSWGATPYIRTKDGYERLCRFMWEYHNGDIPKGFNIHHKDGNVMNCRISNLEMFTDEQMANENAASVKLTDNYVAGVLTHGNKPLRKELVENHQDLIEAKRQQLKLNRKIKEYEK